MRVRVPLPVASLPGLSWAMGPWAGRETVSEPQPGAVISAAEKTWGQYHCSSWLSQCSSRPGLQLGWGTEEHLLGERDCPPSSSEG